MAKEKTSLSEKKPRAAKKRTLAEIQANALILSIIDQVSLCKALKESVLLYVDSAVREAKELENFAAGL